ncbi:MAG: ABC transporter ATP-binding protein [Cyanobacteriota bacterium]|nr:ABC transporter ATP-binding protein [Cyanobacteriota bacterium]
MIWRPIRRLLSPLRGIALGSTPVAQLMRRTATEQWHLIAINLVTGFGQAFLDAMTLGVIYTAVSLLARPGHMNWFQQPIISSIPGLPGLMSSISPKGLFVVLIMTWVVLQAMAALSQYLNAVSASHLAARCTARIKADIHSRILDMSFACASGHRMGYLIKQTDQGPLAISKQIVWINNMVLGVIMSLMYVILLISLSPWLLIVVGLAVATITLLLKLVLAPIKQNSHDLEAVLLDVSCKVNENLANLRLLHSSGEIDHADQRMKDTAADLEAAMRRHGELTNLVAPVSTFLPMATVGLFAGIGVYLVAGRIAGLIPNLVTFVIALQRLNARMSNVAHAYSLLQSNQAPIQFLNEIQADDNIELRRRGGIPFEGLNDSISLENVSLTYGAGDSPALQGINLTIQRGQTVALVGRSGAGKSSVADLLVGLYEPSQGRILIDRQDLSQLDLVSWQQQLGVVSQDTSLINASLADNISFGRPQASRHQIEAAARLAQADGFIDSLPDRYDTVVGERGYRLSGGQRQRISLARAFLRNPELLILDEATSALDSHSERLVQEALDHFGDGHTVLVIAHRLSTIVGADLICVLQDGQIVEQGTHDQLIHLNGVYRDLWSLQASARAVDTAARA